MSNIAAANPEVIRALLDERDELLGALENIREIVESARTAIARAKGEA